MNDLLEQLRNLDPNDPGRWPLAIRLGAVGVVLLVLTFGSVYYFAWQSKQPELEQAQSKEMQLMDTLDAKAKKAANLAAYKEQLKEIEQSFGSMLRQLPNKTEVQSLLVDISQKRLESGLEERLFQPGGEVQHDFYAESPIKIKLTGSFHSLGNFVSGIAALPRIVTLHDITIAAKPKGGYDNLDIEVTAKTYHYLDEEEQAARAATESKTKDSKKNVKKKDAKKAA